MRKLRGFIPTTALVTILTLGATVANAADGIIIASKSSDGIIIASIAAVVNFVSTGIIIAS